MTKMLTIKPSANDQTETLTDRQNGDVELSLPWMEETHNAQPRYINGRYDRWEVALYNGCHFGKEVITYNRPLCGNLFFLMLPETLTCPRGTVYHFVWMNCFVVKELLKV